MSIGNILVQDKFHYNKSLIKMLPIIREHFYYIFVHKNKVMSKEPENTNQLNIEISEEMADGDYANLAIITHSQAEFVFDFVSVMPGAPKSKVKSRIIMTPFHAKRLMRAIVENVQKFEDSNGIIIDNENVEIPFNFGGPVAQA